MVQLIVNDGTVNSDPDTMTIITLNSPPNAVAVLDPPPNGQVFLGDTATLDGSGSSDVDGDSLTYFWSFTSQPPGSTATLPDPSAEKPTFIIDVVGTYGIQLIVNDGTVDSDPEIVNIITGNFLPTADAGSDQSLVEKSSVVLDGSNSLDKDDGIQVYLWEQTAGPKVTLLDGDKAEASFTAPDVNDGEIKLLTFMLTVTDAGGQKATDSSDVSVKNFEKDNPGASGGGCFIATVSYGSPMDSHPFLLREFRDRFLLTNPLGERFMEFYNTYSPPPAGLIVKHESWRKLMQLSLLPLVALAYVMLHISPWAFILSFASILAILLLTRIPIRKRWGCRFLMY